LPPGSHEYKFVVDGQWIADPENPVTIGDFGNSGLVLDAKGRITQAEATSNTAYSAKILLTGRTIGTFRSIRNPDNGDRFELRRPNFDTDLAFGVRMNDALRATIVTNINNEAENVEQYRTRLNFDRGEMAFVNNTLELHAWDNFKVGTWEDPLHLVGGVGIYDHDFGYGTQGVMVQQFYGGFTGRFLYTDNFEDGGQAVPAIDSFFTTVLAAGDAGAFPFWTESAGRLEFSPSARESYRFTSTSGDEDVMAARVWRDVGDIRVGTTARLDRGYNPASYGFLSDIRDTDSLAIDSAPDTVQVPAQTATRTVFNTGTEQWWGVGLDAEAPDLLGDIDLTAEVLYGRAEYVGRFGRRDRVFLATVTDSTGAVVDGVFGNENGDGIVTFDEADTDIFETLDTQNIDLDRSWRLHLGVSDLPRVLGITASAGFELEAHEQAPAITGLADTIHNEMYLYRAAVSRPFRLLGRTLETSLSFESFDFRYEDGTPWVNQFWFDYRNFWLENGEHKVAYDRLVLLGDDAVYWRPSMAADILSSPNVRLEWDGTFASPGMNRQPEYTENLVRGIWKIRPKWQFLADLRFVKYNDALLDLNDSYNETFLELKHEIAPGVEIALSYGVDPWAMDDAVNEYGYIGRDLFLFDRGANAATARTNYFGLASAIRTAEGALAKERLFQLEAMMRF
jgi:hypothetical protein